MAIRAISLILMFTTVFLAAAEKLGLKLLENSWSTLVVLAAALAAIPLVIDRDTYLPFLGPTHLPPTALKTFAPYDASVTLTVDVPPEATHVLYWAANSSASGVSNKNPWDAYSGFGNSGLVKTNGAQATLLLRCPQAYNVRGRSLARHCHYRYVFGESGMLSRVFTKDIKCV